MRHLVVSLRAIELAISEYVFVCHVNVSRLQKPGRGVGGGARYVSIVLASI